MKKFLAFFVLLAGLSFFLTEASSIEIEIQKESDRVIESMGWLEPEKVAYQEQLQIVIDYTGSKNRLSVGMLSTDPNDIQFPDYMEDISNEPKIISFIITNQFACAPNKIEQACVIIDVEREGLGMTSEEIRMNTREITDKIVGGGVIMFAPEFDSVTLQKKTKLDGEETLVSRAKYTINKQSTDSLFGGITNMVVSADIRDSGGFYDMAKEVSKHNFSAFTVSLIPLENNTILRTLQVSLVCSDEIQQYVRCPENVSEQIKDGTVSPLDFVGVEKINRSALFENDFFPLNSIIEVIIFSEEGLEVKSVNTNLIGKFTNLGDIQDNGWFLSPKAGQKIDARYIFGQSNSVNKNDLIFSIGPNTGDSIKKEEEGGGCLIATAAFGSEMAPQVQLLREFRDGKVMTTQTGTTFMTEFNQFYYSFSPAIADYERENPAFKEAVKITLTPLLTSLTLLQYADIDSESEMLGYGIGVILLNIGMYFVAPAILIMKIKKLI